MALVVLNSSVRTMVLLTNLESFTLNKSEIVRVQYFVRGGFVVNRSHASSSISPSSSGRRARFLGGQKGVALQVQDARVGVGSNKRCRLDVDVRRSDITGG
ncbi:hypothetical protein TNCV_2008461 [Trichonephila clavipes]|nr:hypothetical protein TNCV_2008461 [Trichonephila clavipes]